MYGNIDKLIKLYKKIVKKSPDIWLKILKRSEEEEEEGDL
jgi:hypothetical protein